MIAITVPRCNWIGRHGENIKCYMDKSASARAIFRTFFSHLYIKGQLGKAVKEKTFFPLVGSDRFSSDKKNMWRESQREKEMVGTRTHRGRKEGWLSQQEIRMIDLSRFVLDCPSNFRLAQLFFTSYKYYFLHIHTSRQIHSPPDSHMHTHVLQERRKHQAPIPGQTPIESGT